MGDSPRFQTEKEHYYAADDGDDADPINGLDASDKRCPCMLEFEEEEEHEECKAVKRKVNIELMKRSARHFSRKILENTYTPPP